MLTTVRAAAVATTAVCLSATASCSDGRAPPSHLVDGSPARVASIPFEGVTVPVIATVTRRGLVEGERCAPNPSAGARTITRVGVAGTSVTLVAPDALYACDAAGRGKWCGQGFARRSARSFDPRLSITCRDADGSPIGFAWVVPHTDAGYVVVAHDDYAEAFAAAEGAPVRVTTSEVDVATSSARFELTEHAADGRLLAARSVEAQVSG